jgi:outer membrane protein OmpA-like peptidoglycan-associated protein
LAGEPNGGGTQYFWQEVVEVKGMDTGKMVFVDSSAMEKAINATGHVALYGILFDFDKADIKPESKPTLDEIAKYVKANPKVGISIVGHTDNKGGPAYNQNLSNLRAQAVAAALASQYGVAADRLTASGAGMSMPLTSNDTEDGRAKNRRVELVKQ